MHSAVFFGRSNAREHLQAVVPSPDRLVRFNVVEAVQALHRAEDSVIGEVSTVRRIAAEEISIESSTHQIELRLPL